MGAEAAFLVPLPFLPSLLSPGLHGCDAGGRGGTVWDWVGFSEHLQYPICKPSPREKEGFLAEFYLRPKEKENRNWLPGNLGYSLIFKKWD